MQAADWTKTGVKGELTYSTFGCNPFQEANFPTPDRVVPDVNVERHMDVSLDLPTPDGKKIRVWTFTDPLAPTPAGRAARLKDAGGEP